MNVQEAAKLIAMAAAVMPNTQEFNLQATALAWATFMPDIPYSIGQKVLAQVIRQKQIATLPQPGEIVPLAKEMMAQENKTQPPSVYEAWDEVCSKLGSTSRNGITWSNPLVKKAVQCVGAYNIATATYDIFPRFAKVYEGILKQKSNEYEGKVAQIIQHQGLIKRLEAPQDLRAIANRQMLNGKQPGATKEVS